MSLILDALRRADADRERERAAVPGLHDQLPVMNDVHGPDPVVAEASRRRWHWALVPVVAVASAALGWWWLQPGPPLAPAVAAARGPAGPAAESPGAAPPADPAAAAVPPAAAAAAAVPPAGAGAADTPPATAAGPTATPAAPTAAPAAPPATPLAAAASVPLAPLPALLPQPAPPPSLKPDPAAPPLQPQLPGSSERPAPAVRQERPPRPPPAAAPPASPRAPAAAGPGGTPGAAPGAAQRAAPRAAPGAPAPAEPAPLPALSALPDHLRRELPALVVNGAVYSPQAASRMLVVNGQVLREGQGVAGPAAGTLTLEQIGPKSAVLSYKGQRFELPY
jgi:general secretion pathway protein B